jgi:hypothetical protein
MGVNKMSYYKIIDAFTYYGADVVALSILTSALTQLLKVTLLKKANKKFITFVPFIIGTLLFAAYYAIANLSVLVLISEYSYVLERGVTVGTLATVIYIIYEQFGRGGGSGGSGLEGLILSLIEAYVRSDCKDEAVKEVQNSLISGADSGEIVKLLNCYAEENVTEADLENLSYLLISAYKSLKK